MSHSIKVFYYALWILHPVLQLGIAGFMWKRGLVRKFKFFFGYILAQLATFAVLFPAYFWHSYSALFYLYWSCNAVSVACGFLVIHEIFVDVFRLFHTLRDLGTVLFKWAGLVMLLVAGVVSISTNSPEISPLLQAITTAQRSVRMIQVGMVLFLLFFAHYVGVNRRRHSFGIALGFGSFAVIELILICSWVGNHLTGAWPSIINMTAYNGSLALWLSYVAVKQTARDVTPSMVQPQRWEKSLSDIHHPLPADSLIPMFEGMVERALTRTQEAAAAHEEKEVTSQSRAAAAAHEEKEVTSQSRAAAAASTFAAVIRTSKG
jgi:hypothetical protein